MEIKLIVLLAFLLFFVGCISNGDGNISKVNIVVQDANFDVSKLPKISIFNIEKCSNGLISRNITSRETDYLCRPDNKITTTQGIFGFTTEYWEINCYQEEMIENYKPCGTSFVSVEIAVLKLNKQDKKFEMIMQIKTEKENNGFFEAQLEEGIYAITKVKSHYGDYELLELINKSLQKRADKIGFDATIQEAINQKNYVNVEKNMVIEISKGVHEKYLAE